MEGEYLKKIFKRVIVLVLILMGIILIFILNESLRYGKVPIMKTCGDSSYYDSCSLNKPLFCSNEGVLVERASVCGCDEGYFSSEESCISDLYTGEKLAKFNYYFEGEKKILYLKLYSGINDYVKSLPRFRFYSEGEVPQRADFKLLKINDDLQRDALKELVYKIQNLAPDSKIDQARIAISLVQNIPYEESSEEIVFGESLRLSLFPYEVLYENSGSCEGKSELLVLLLRELDYGTAFFYYAPENHESVGIKCPLEKSLIGSGYCFIETTSPSILGDFGGDYYGTGKLNSKPQVIFINEGLSLPKHLKEYRDSKSLMKFRSEISFWNLFQKIYLQKLDKEYGIKF